MKIHFLPLNSQDDHQIQTFINWNNDPEISHFITPNRTAKELEPITYDKAKSMLFSESKNTHLTYFIYDDDKLIGDYSLQMNPCHLMKKEESTSWLGLTIGDKSYWGKGVAQIAMSHFIEESKKLKAQRIELGVFSFNYRAVSFYKKQGFAEIGKIPEFTYWNGKFWDDIRMEKNLSD